MNWFGILGGGFVCVEVLDEDINIGIVVLIVVVLIKICEFFVVIFRVVWVFEEVWVWVFFNVSMVVLGENVKFEWLGNINEIIDLSDLVDLMGWRFVVENWEILEFIFDNLSFKVVIDVNVGLVFFEGLCMNDVEFLCLELYVVDKGIFCFCEIFEILIEVKYDDDVILLIVVIWFVIIMVWVVLFFGRNNDDDGWWFIDGFWINVFLLNVDMSMEEGEGYIEVLVSGMFWWVDVFFCCIVDMFLLFCFEEYFLVVVSCGVFRGVVVGIVISFVVIVCVENCK